MAGGVVKPPVTPEEVLLDETLEYVFFADRWQWPPDVVDNLPVHLYARFPIVAAVRDEVEAEAQRAAARRGAAA